MENVKTPAHSVYDIPVPVLSKIVTLAYFSSDKSTK